MQVAIVLFKAGVMKLLNPHSLHLMDFRIPRDTRSRNTDLLLYST